MLGLGFKGGFEVLRLLDLKWAMTRLASFFGFYMAGFLHDLYF